MQFTGMEVKVGVHQGFVLLLLFTRPLPRDGGLPLLFAIVVDVITDNSRRDVVNELLYADDLVLMSKTMEDLKERFWN